MAEMLIWLWLAVILIASSGFILGFMVGWFKGLKAVDTSEVRAREYIEEIYNKED